MAKEALDLWSEELAKAFRGSGPDVTERSVFGGRAFLVGGTLVAVVENVSGQLRTRFREVIDLCPDKQKAATRRSVTADYELRLFGRSSYGAK